MPANPKYLTKSPWQQFAKISAGIIGGYIVTALFHMCLALCLPNPKEMLATFIYTYFIIWCALLVIPFIAKNGWKIWGIYIAISLILFGIYYVTNQQNPFV